MFKRIFQNLLDRTGKTYKIDSRIPDRLFAGMLFSRLIMMLRGLTKTGRKIFVGRQTKICNSANFLFGSGVTIERHCVIDAYSAEPVRLGNNVKIGAFSTVSCTSHMSKYGKGLRIGDNSAIGEYSYFGASGGIEIGSDVIMGQYISFHSENHNFTDSGKLIREQGVTSKGIKIGNNVWVGAKATFLDGCIVGDRSVVASGAVVNGIYPENSVIGGVPAKVIKSF